TQPTSSAASDVYKRQPLESLTKKQMDAGESYLSVMQENLTALKKTTDVAGKEIKTEKETAAEQTIYLSLIHI
ncbi:hypothetical protein KQJ29_35030, partial [Enterococcus sp. S181_ASV_20]|nr:hypothetical protein [Enterococcus sp. S181_ASV_20]